MSNISNRILSTRVADFLFVVALVLEVVSQCLGSSELPRIYGVGSIFAAMKWAAVFLALVKMVFFTKYDAHGLVFSVVLVSASVLSWWYSGSDYVIMMSFFVIAAKDIDYALICKAASTCCLLCIAIVIAMSTIGLLPNIVQSESYLFGFLIESHSLGFQHVNFLGDYVLLSVMCILYLRKDRIGIRDYVALLALAAVLYLYINTRTSAALLAMTAGLLFPAQYRLSKRLLVTLCISLSVGAALLSFILPNLYQSGNAVMDLIDEALSKRLSFAATFLEDYGVLPFGQELELVSTIEASETGQTMAILDNAYLHLLLRFGLVPFLLYSGMYVALVRKSIRANDLTLLVMCTSILVCSVAEKWGFMVGYNMVLLSLFAHSSKPPKQIAGARVAESKDRRVGYARTVQVHETYS